MQQQLSQQRALKVMTLGVTLLAILVEWYARRCGFLVTSDSLQYMSAARSFRTSGVFLSPDGSHYAYWPPLFPVLLSVFKDPIWSVTAINTICKLVLGWLVYRLSVYYLTHFATRVAFVVGVLFGLHLLLISVFIWSELVFVTLALAMLYRYTHCRGRLFDGAMLLSGFFLCLQRNAGLFWILGLCASWLLAQDFSLKNVARAAAFFAVATSGMWAWNIYNTWFVASDFNFYRQSFLSAMVGNGEIAGNSLARAFFPATRHALWGLLFWMFTMLAIWLIWNFRTHAIALPLCLAVAFCTGFIVLGPLDGYEADRYFCLVPMLLYLPLLRMFEAACNRFLISKRAAVAVLILLSVYPVTRTVRNAQRWHARSCQYPQAPIRTNEM